MQEDKSQIFVYGTLKRGFQNQNKFIEGSEHFKQVGYYKTEDKFVMIKDMYQIPYLTKLEGKGHQISGDLFLVDKDGLMILDELEGVPERYSRKKIKVQLDKHNIESQIQIINREIPKIESREFISEQLLEQNEKYSEFKREDRDLAKLQYWGGYE